MARPKTSREKKGNFSLSLTPTEAKAFKSRALKLGFPNPSNYALALHEAEQRLELVVKSNSDGQHWFFIPERNDPVPEDVTLGQALEARREDFETALRVEKTKHSKPVTREMLESLQDKLQKHPARPPAAEKTTH